MKICYLILLHHKFDQATRLITKLATPESCFIIHVDKKVDDDKLNTFQQSVNHVPSVQFVKKRENGKWGSFNLAAAALRLIEHAVQTQTNADRFLLLSGQDYPIASNKKILDFISKHPDEEFVEAFPMDIDDKSAEGWSPYYRFRRYHIWVGKRRMALPFIIKKKPKIRMYHGAQWWLLTQKAVQFLAHEFETNKKWNTFLSSGFLVDEAYIPSLLKSSVFSSKITGKNVTYADWKNPTGPHPKTLIKVDIDNILSSDALFARKFDAAIDTKVLDLIDKLTTPQ